MLIFVLRVENYRGWRWQGGGRNPQWSNILKSLCKIIKLVQELKWKLSARTVTGQTYFYLWFWEREHITLFRILGNCPTWRTNSFQCIYLFIVLYMFRACHAHHQEKQTVSIQLLVIVTPCWWQCRVLVGGKPTRSDNYQKLYWYNLFLLMISMTWSKHVENYK